MPRALFVLLPLAAGCAASPRAPERTFVHPESATDVRLIEALDSAPKEKTPPTLFDYVWKTPLVIPTVTAMWVKDTPRAIAELAMLPVAIVAGLLEAVGILKPDREPPPKRRDRDQ